MEEKIAESLAHFSSRGSKVSIKIDGEMQEIATIVRCKDCKYHAPDMCCNHPIEWNNGESRNHCNPNWFCADGERWEHGRQRESEAGNRKV